MELSAHWDAPNKHHHTRKTTRVTFLPYLDSLQSSCPQISVASNAQTYVFSYQ